MNQDWQNKTQLLDQWFATLQGQRLIEQHQVILSEQVEKWTSTLARDLLIVINPLGMLCEADYRHCVSVSGDVDTKPDIVAAANALPFANASSDCVVLNYVYETSESKQIIIIKEGDK